MKKLPSFFVIATLISLLFSCNDISDDVESRQVSGANKVTVSLSVNQASFRSTIMPTNLSESDISQVELEAKIEKDGSYTPYKFGEDESKIWESLEDAQSASIELDFGTYNFTLNIYADERVVQTKTIEDVEISKDSTVIDFGTTEYSDSGKLSLTFAWTTDTANNAIFDLKTGLYEITEKGGIGTVLTGFEAVTLETSIEDSTNCTAVYAPEEEIPNGSYFLKVQILSKEEEPKVINTITEIVKIKGYKTEKTINLNLDDINWSGEPKFKISIKVDDSSDINVVENSDALNASASAGTNLVFTADEGYDSYSWTVEGETQDSTTNELPLDVVDWASGVYDVYLSAEKDGQYYSYTAQITWKQKFRVNFVTNKEGEEVDPQYFIEDGTEKVVAPTLVPTCGWFVSTDGGETLSETPYDFENAEAPAYSFTLYGQWDPRPITLDTGSEINSLIAGLIEGVAETQTLIFAKSSTEPETASYYLDEGGKIPVWYDETDSAVYFYVPEEYRLMLNADSSKMFKEFDKFTSIDVSAFDTSNVTEMNGMFWNCSALTSLDLSSFDTSRVTNMGSLFDGCSALETLNLSSFDTSSVTDMNSMFSGCSALNSVDLSTFDTSSVENMGEMFYNCKTFTSLDLNTFNTSSVTSMKSMFDGCTYLETLTFGENFTTENVTDMSSMFKDCLKLEALDLTNFTTANVTNMRAMFYSCGYLRTLDVSKFDTSKVTDMSFMFRGCDWLESLDVSNFNTSKVTNMAYMFYGCSALTSLDLSNFDASALVVPTTDDYKSNTDFMFYGCTNLESVTLPSTGLKKIGYCAFLNDTSLTSIIIHASVTAIGGRAFDGCTALTAINCKGAEGSINIVSDAIPSTATVNYNYVVLIGSKSAPDAVGDIVFSDGSAEAYTEGMTLTDEQKSSAVAVIFYKGELCSSDGTTTRILGVGLKNSSSESTDGLKWAADGSYYSDNSASVSLYSTGCRFTGDSASICTPTDDINGFDRQTSGDKEGVVNGSENFALLKNKLGSNDDTDDVSSTTTVTLEVSKYPAHFYANTYGVRNGLTGDYASGWYLPSFAEMCMLMRQHETLESALTMLGDSLYGADPDGTRTDDDTSNDAYNWYWTSSYTGSGFWAVYYDMAMGFNYNESMHVLAIRQF